MSSPLEHPRDSLRDVLSKALPIPLAHTHFRELGERYEGKVRDNYRTPDGRRFLITTDRVSAFDRVLGTLPLKGQVLNRMAAFWFEATRLIAPNHMLRVPDPNVLEAHECEPIAAEFVVRAYMTGVTSTSLWTHYSRGDRIFAGHTLPDGLRKNEPLPQPLLTPSTKAEQGGHDITASRDELVRSGKVTAHDFDRAAQMAMALFAFGQNHCAQHGLILVDTKYEFGKLPNGEVVVIDEMHTPDSSRFWFVDSYSHRLTEGVDPESFDKEYLRRWLDAAGFRGEGPVPHIPDNVRIEASMRYIQAFERITGEPFVPNLEEPLGRIRNNLGLPR